MGVHGEVWSPLHLPLHISMMPISKKDKCVCFGKVGVGGVGVERERWGGDQ